MKQCLACGKLKELSKFNFRKETSKYINRCKTCVKNKIYVNNKFKPKIPNLYFVYPHFPDQPQLKMIHSFDENDIEYKFCCNCNTWLVLTNFSKCLSKKDKLNNMCKHCLKLKRSTPFEKLKHQQYNNNPTVKQRYLELRLKNKNNKIQYDIEYRSNPINKNRKKLVDKSYRTNPVIKAKLQVTQHKYIRNPINKKRRNIRESNRLKTDPTYKLICNERKRQNRLLKHNKTNSTSEYLGCTINDYKIFLESQFKSNMSWINYGTLWHIDHIIPLCNFNMLNEYEQLIAFNYKNTRPLLKIENLQRPKYTVLLDELKLVQNRGVKIPSYIIDSITSSGDIN